MSADNMETSVVPAIFRRYLSKHETWVIFSSFHGPKGSVKRINSRPLKKKMSSYSLFGICNSCNGLFLVRMDDDLFLWNPLTRYCKKVLAYESLVDNGYRKTYGLCYDSSSNEYKAVLAMSHSSAYYGGEFVVVGSFRNKHWTRVQFPCLKWIVNSGPVVNGHLHWFADKRCLGGHCLSTQQIVSFTAQKNKFKKVPMPRPKEDDGDIILGLGVLDGCLSMVRRDNPSHHEGISVEILVMKEYGVETSWTILFSISTLTRLRSYYELEPLCSTKNGEVIMRIWTGNDKGHIRAYKPNQNSHRDIPFPNDRYNILAIAYEESLVTPPAYNWEEEEFRGEATYVEKFLSGSLQKLIKVKGGGWENIKLEDTEYEELVSKELQSEESESESED